MDSRSQLSHTTAEEVLSKHGKEQRGYRSKTEDTVVIGCLCLPIFLAINLSWQRKESEPNLKQSLKRANKFQIKDRDNALKCGHNEGHFQPNSFAINLSSWQRKKTESNLRRRPVINQNFNTCDFTLLFNEFHISL